VRYRGEAILAWRAPSSPHLACGLNRSFFLRFCALLDANQAGRTVGVLGSAEPCETLRGGVVGQITWNVGRAAFSGAPSEKGNFGDLGHSWG